MVLKEINEALRRQGWGIRLGLSQIEEQIDALSEEDREKLLEWMENQLEDEPSEIDEDEEEDFDPEPEPYWRPAFKGGGWY